VALSLSRLWGSFPYEETSKARQKASKKASKQASGRRAFWADVHEKGENGTCGERGVAVLIRLLTS
jgi:hypothetical protein